jgi:hypothetical protein
MSSPEWYGDLATSLKEYFDQNQEIKNVSGEQFLRNYLLDKPVKNYSEEDGDQFIDDHLDPIQAYLNGLEWVKIDYDSIRWLKESVENKHQTSVIYTDKPIYNKSRLDNLVSEKEDLKSEDIEWAKQELLILDQEYEHTELLRYYLAKSISKHDNYTSDDKAEAWYLAAMVSSSTTKSVECLEKASDFKVSQYKFDEAALYLKKAIYKLEPELEIKRNKNKIVYFFYLIRRRFNISFQRLNNDTHEKTMGLVRKCRVFYEQAGNRDESSHLFVLESDIDKRSKNKPSQLLVFVYWLFAQYGESPLRVLISSLLIISIWAIIYTCMGINYNLNSDDGEIGKLTTNLYFSIVTFTTLGYGDFSPPVAGRIIASIQAMLGLFMTSLFLVTFVRRYSR